MTFFIPFAANPIQADRICQRTQQRLIALGYSPLTDRVYEIQFYRDGRLLTDTIGDLCPITGETVMLIFKNDVGYLVCSYSRGVAGGEPLIIKYNTIESVTLFDDSDV